MIKENVLVRLLVYAYRAELNEAEVIFTLLPEIPSEEDWKTLMTMLKDNMIHAEMLERAMKALGRDVPEVEPIRLHPVSDRNKALEFIAKFENTAYNYYKYLLENVDFESLSNGKEIRDTLRTLTEWEKRHIEMIRKTLDNFKVRYKIL